MLSGYQTNKKTITIVGICMKSATQHVVILSIPGGSFYPLISPEYPVNSFVPGKIYRCKCGNSKKYQGLLEIVDYQELP